MEIIPLITLSKRNIVEEKQELYDTINDKQFNLEGYEKIYILDLDGIEKDKPNLKLGFGRAETELIPFIFFSKGKILGFSLSRFRMEEDFLGGKISKIFLGWVIYFYLKILKITTAKQN